MASIPQTTRQFYYPELGSYKNLTVKEVEVPKPKANEVLVKVHAVSLQFRDLMIATGRYPGKIAEQLVPCSDMAGEIVALGQEVSGWKEGDRICANFGTDHIYGDTNPAIKSSHLGGQSQGTLTEYRTFPTHSLVSIPDHLSYEEASTLPCAAVTAYNALYGGVPLKAGDTVLVLGTGGVSIFALQFAVAAGATVFATSSSDEKLQVAKKLGAKHLINYKKTPEWHEEVRKLTGGKGVDHIVEVGGSDTFEKSLQAVRHAGYIYIIGAVSGVGASNVIGGLIEKAITLRGIQIGSVAQFEAMNRLIIANPDVTKPVVDKVFPFDKAIEAFAHLESQAHVGKVVIKLV